MLIGIIVQYHISISPIWSVSLILLGLFVMLFSYFLPDTKAYKFRWVYGSGLYCTLFSIGILTTDRQQRDNHFSFSEANFIYKAVIVDVPVEKQEMIELKLLLDDYDKKIIAHLPRDSFSLRLTAGQKITFFSKIVPFRKVGNIHNFNYNQYLYNQGFVGISNIPSDTWEDVGNDDTQFSIKIFAYKCRTHILDYFESLNFNKEQLAFVSGFLFGDKTYFSEDLLQSFRATGTAHILAVSGLHVGIVYSALIFLFGNIRSKTIKQPLILLLLWFYIFMAGLPVSGIRAGLMLSFFCIATFFGSRTYSLNSIFAAAFFILLIMPFSLFDAGFQLSFVAATSICLLMPYFEQAFCFKNKFAAFASNTIIICFVAQVGVFPLMLYYFGSFSVYFLFANFLIIPVLSILFVDILLLCLFSLIGMFSFAASSFLSIVPVTLFNLCVKWIVLVVHFFENLPYSLIDNVYISSFLVFALFFLFIFLCIHVNTRSSVSLICVLSCCLAIFVSYLYDKFQKRDTIQVINNIGASALRHQTGFDVVYSDSIWHNKVLISNDQIFYILVDNHWHAKASSTDRPVIDYLMLETGDVISVTVLYDLFRIRKIIFGNRISRRTVSRLISECEKLRIPYYDIYSEGNLTINF